MRACVCVFVDVCDTYFHFILQLVFFCFSVSVAASVAGIELVAHDSRRARPIPSSSMRQRDNCELASQNMYSFHFIHYSNSWNSILIIMIRFTSFGPFITLSSSSASSNLSVFVCFSSFEWVLLNCCRAFICCFVSDGRRKKNDNQQSVSVSSAIGLYTKKMRDEQKHPQKKCLVSVSPISICGAVLPPFNNQTKTNENNTKKSTEPEQVEYRQWM